MLCSPKPGEFRQYTCAGCNASWTTFNKHEERHPYSCPLFGDWQMEKDRLEAEKLDEVVRHGT